MKILMVSSYLPYPLFSGGHIRLYNLLKNLSENYDIVLVCEKRPYQTEKDVKEVEKLCRTLITFDRKRAWSLKNVLKTGFSTNPFLLTTHRNLKMKREIEDLLKKEKFDLVHVETFYVMQNLPKVSIPVVLTEHNIEYQIYKRYKDSVAFFLRPLLNIDILKLENQEEKFWKRANCVVTVSKEDKEIIEMFNRRVYMVPNGVDLEKFKIQNSKFKIDKKEKTVLFIGDFKWVQNRDSLEWILKKIWPLFKSKVKSQKSKVKLWVVGKNIPDKFKNPKNTMLDLVVDGNAPDDTTQIFQKADLLLSPIRVGGGTSYKILEAMASGVPIITTKLGADPLGAVDGKEIIISEDEEEIADKIISLLNDRGLYEKIAKNARKLVEKKYDWKKITKKLEDVYLSVVH